MSWKTIIIQTILGLFDIFFISFLNGVLGEICKKSDYFTNFARKSDSSFPKNSLIDFKIANLPPYYPGVTK